MQHLFLFLLQNLLLPLVSLVLPFSFCLFSLCLLCSTVTQPYAQPKHRIIHPMHTAHFLVPFLPTQPSMQTSLSLSLFSSPHRPPARWQFLRGADSPQQSLIRSTPEVTQCLRGAPQPFAALALLDHKILGVQLVSGVMVETTWA